MQSVRWNAWYGLLSATQAGNGDARSSPRQPRRKSTSVTSNLARPALRLALPALLLGSGAATAMASDFDTVIPPGYGEPASDSSTGANLVVTGDDAIPEPLGGHSLQLGPGTALSWNGVTLYDHGSYPEDPTDARPDIDLAPGFTPLLLSPGAQSSGPRGARNRAARRNIRSEKSRSGRRSRLALGLSQSLGPFDFAVTGDYGRFKLPVRPELDLSKEEKLLRLGGKVELGGFQVRGSMGAEVKPFPPAIGNTLAWDLAATFDEGPWAFGLAYTHSLLADAPNDEEVDTLGTLQSGVRYAISPNMSAGLHGMFFSFTDKDSEQDTDLAGVLSFSMRF